MEWGEEREREREREQEVGQLLGLVVQAVPPLPRAVVLPPQ